jgi:branched-subunit amino acid transport protein
MTTNFIYLSIVLASAATYFCRAFGIFSAKNLSVDSSVFQWIKCISIGIISAVIAKIILFPAGLLAETSSSSRLFATAVAIAIYFLFKKNVLLSVFVSTMTFVIINFYI